MLSRLEVLSLREKAVKNIGNLKSVKEHLVDSKEYQLARDIQEKINRYWRDVKVLDIVLDSDSPNHNLPKSTIDED